MAATITEQLTKLNQLRQQLAAEGQLTDRQQGETRFYVSDRPEDFEKLAAVFLEEPLSRGAERIDIEQY